MFGPDFMEELERVKDRIENGLDGLGETCTQLVWLAKITTGALIICAASLVWIATK